MKVYINGKLLPLESGKWRYLKDSNSIEFSLNDPLQAGDKIKVIYPRKRRAHERSPRNAK